MRNKILAFLFNWFKLPEKPKEVWLGSSRSCWVKDMNLPGEGDNLRWRNVYHFYIEGDKRICKTYGNDAKLHKHYIIKIKPWLDGCPFDNIKPILFEYNIDFWPEDPKESPKKTEFKLLKFDNNKED